MAGRGTRRRAESLTSGSRCRPADEHYSAYVTGAWTPPRTSRRPSREDLVAARGATVPDVFGAELRVLFCGINPSLYSAAVGHHFARPGNRFWKALHESGFTERLLSPYEDGTLPASGIGITNLVARATAAATELSDRELRRGREVLTRKVGENRPAVVAVLGVQAYRTAFRRRDAHIGPQSDTVGGVRLWLLPNPSGAQARYQLADLVELFRELREAAYAGDLSDAGVAR